MDCGEKNPIVKKPEGGAPREKTHPCENQNRKGGPPAKLSSLPGPSKPAREKPALTPALRSVMRAHLQYRFVIESPFVSSYRK
jgi:hypothetical protein